MYGIFVNENGCVHYAELLARGIKTIETRNRNMLSALVGKRVAIVKTRRGKKPTVVGYVTISGSAFCKAEDFGKYEDFHLVMSQSKYAPQNGRGKWFYFCDDAETCEPYPLPEYAVRHGRSWCEWQDDTSDYVRLRSYYPDGRFTSCEHLFMGRNQVKALEWFRREYPAHHDCIVTAESYDSKDPKNAEHFDACKRCGCVYPF